MKHRDKYQEMSFHLQNMEKSFLAGDGNYLHYFNGFLSSAQSVFYCLNKEFNKHPLYEAWQTKRSERLPGTAKTFKELRNVSEKEGPVKNSGIIIGFHFGEGVSFPPEATLTLPAVDRRTGRLVSNKGTITTKEGITTEVQVEPMHDFLVTVQSDGKTHRLNGVISEARQYAEAILKEINEAEAAFAK